MKLEWIDDLLAITDAGSLSAAAAQRFVTQSAFSRRVRAIERSVGTELIDRTCKPANLNSAVLELEPRLRELSQSLHALAHELSQTNQQKNELVIVSQHAISTAIAPKLIKTLSTHEDVRVRLRSANREECYSLLFSKQADIGLIYQIEGEQTVKSTQFVETTPLTNEPLVPVISQQQEEHFRRDLDTGIVRAIAYPQSVFLGSVLARYLQPQFDENTSIHWVAETGLTTAALQLACIGMGLAWVPLSLAIDALDRKELIRLDPELPSVSMQVVATRIGWQNAPLLDHTWQALTASASPEIEPMGSN